MDPSLYDDGTSVAPTSTPAAAPQAPTPVAAPAAPAAVVTDNTEPLPLAALSAPRPTQSRARMGRRAAFAVLSVIGVSKMMGVGAAAGHVTASVAPPPATSQEAAQQKLYGALSAAWEHQKTANTFEGFDAGEGILVAAGRTTLILTVAVTGPTGPNCAIAGIQDLGEPEVRTDQQAAACSAATIVELRKAIAAHDAANGASS